MSNFSTQETVNTPLQLDGESLTIEQVVQVARLGRKVELAELAKERITRSRQVLERLAASGKPIYGVNTGFGLFSDQTISEGRNRELQLYLIRSNACGVGLPVGEDIVRAMMLLRANVLAKGFSGVRLVLIERLLDFLNQRIHPVIPEQGSVGASGDLVPLAHMALSLIGEGEVTWQGKTMPTGEALRQAGIEPLVLESKEGNALINGTQFMAAFGCLALADSTDLSVVADIAGALTWTALRGNRDAYDERIQAVRPHAGQMAVAKHLRQLIANPERAQDRPARVQDVYSLRCMPQIHGASRDTMAFAETVLATEINSATDNPLVFPEAERVMSGGNFHGQYLALALDFLGIAVAELASVSERRTEQLVNPNLSGLPAFLTEPDGLKSGLMLLQYVAAALVSENKVLASPASVDSIPTQAGLEDHVSMGPIAARKATQIIANTRNVLAIELISAAQAIDMGETADSMGAGVRVVYELVRQRVPFVSDDRPLRHDIARIAEAIERGELSAAVHDAIS